MSPAPLRDRLDQGREPRLHRKLGSTDLTVKSPFHPERLLIDRDVVVELLDLGQVAPAPLLGRLWPQGACSAKMRSAISRRGPSFRDAAHRAHTAIGRPARSIGEFVTRRCDESLHCVSVGGRPLATPHPGRLQPRWPPRWVGKGSALPLWASVARYIRRRAGGDLLSVLLLGAR
jgi:hypothetical protein